MPIANVLKSINVPVLGKSLYRTEDQFLPSEFSMSNGPLDKSKGFKSDATVPQEIIIACKGKRRRINGYLSDGVELNGVAEWEPITNATGISSLNNGLNTLSTLGQMGFGGTSNNGTQYSTGTVIQQPWMNRKFWKGTKPFELAFEFNLVSETSSKNDVFLPAVALMSFLFPRIVDNCDGVNALKEKAREFISQNTNTAGNKNLANALIDAMQTYCIPGPSLLYGAKGNEDGSLDNGDAVTIVVGNMFAFGACYLKTVKLKFSPNIDYSGYPTWCKCSITAEAMDSNVCNSDGSFDVSPINDSAAAGAELLQALTDLGIQVAKDAANIAKATVNAISAYGQILEK